MGFFGFLKKNKKKKEPPVEKVPAEKVVIRQNGNNKPRPITDEEAKRLANALSSYMKEDSK